MPQRIDHLSLYRLPWSLTDNPIAWLEPTQACNLACDGCYRQNVKAHKPIAEVQAELDTFARLRNFDGVSIAGAIQCSTPRSWRLSAAWRGWTASPSSTPTGWA